MKKVMVFGTFDGIHPGHIDMMHQAKKLGDYLIAVVGRDTTVDEVKGRHPTNTEEERLEAVRNLSVVDEAVLGDSDDKLAVIEKYCPDVIGLGYDQQSFTDSLEENLSKRGIKTTIVRLKAHEPHRFKSSLMNGSRHKNK